MFQEVAVDLLVDAVEDTIGMDGQRDVFRRGNKG